MQTHPRAAPATSLRQAEKWLHTYHLDRFVSPRLDGREVRLQVDEESKARVEFLDGCYVLERNPRRRCSAACNRCRHPGCL